MADKILWSVRDVMAVIPLGKTTIIEIIKSLPHINMGRKLLVAPEAIMAWVRTNTVTPEQQMAQPVISKPRKARTTMPMTEDGFIPRRRSGGKA